jgi:hypothetical protein
MKRAMDVYKIEKVDGIDSILQHPEHKPAEG